MDDEEDVLEIGRRGRRPVLTRVLITLVLVAAVGGYLVVHDRGDHTDQQAGPSAPAAPPGTPTTVTISTFGPPPTPPPWPQVTEACGGEAFLPIVSAAPLDTATGLHVVAGDRLRTVNVDTGTVKAAAGLPRGQFASEVATAGNGTFALLAPCVQPYPQTSILVRLTSTGGLQRIARGQYLQLLSGGDHVWAELLPAKSNGPSVLDPLDGGPRRTMPKGFVPLAAYRDLIVGEVTLPSDSDGSGPYTIELLDPSTGKVRLSLGPAGSVGVDSGLIVWTPAGCRRCSVHTYDLATGAGSVTPGGIASGIDLWSAVVSPDHRLLAFVRQRSTPAKYQTDHPGNPNEIAVLHLDTGRIEAVPGIVLWSKSFPGLAFSADSVWLAITLDEGTSVRLLVWHPGMPSALQSPARLEGRVAYPPWVTPAL